MTRRIGVRGSLKQIASSREMHRERNGAYAPFFLSWLKPRPSRMIELPPIIWGIVAAPPTDMSHLRRSKFFLRFSHPFRGGLSCAAPTPLVRLRSSGPGRPLIGLRWVRCQRCIKTPTLQTEGWGTRSRGLECELIVLPRLIVKREAKSCARLRMTERCLRASSGLGDGLGDSLFPAALGFED